MPRTRSPAPAAAARSNRRLALLMAAARHFAHGGFEAASMRDIAREVGMLAGSMYYHFDSKDALIEELYALGVGQVTAAVERALADAVGPWPRFEAACVGHLEALLADSSFARVLTADLSHVPARLRRRLVARRDAYEQHFTVLIADLPLPPDVDRQLLRLHVLGALNWTPTWYRRGVRSPADIARAVVQSLRRP
ncbi:TetR/AcrR family transcriptional regulator [Reyranella sp. CPCC 100927]|uniref:TetR/AcrR family transcriptional regulator n=1 Tax=Reyranella sp. CPCC 100927 TaxID=2599616 RepID=UPI0011B66D77|nr:TetR/AcrR family transcriptional regulator [Reyranella sp. CPCC 100927]TWT13590.1 helix-turn-helix transcriptional regulator [Reyranella sp. CPCC 100927]